MTEFSRTPHPSPVPEERRAAIVADPGFGRHFTDHMVTIPWTAEKGWHTPSVVPYGPLLLDPASMVLHYGQEIFEGLKAYQQPDGSVASFRPEANAARFRASASRLAMAELPDELFLASLSELLSADRAWVPPAGGEESVYLRPFMLATEVGLGVRPSAEYLYVLIASPAGAYFPGGVQPVNVWLCTDYTRAAVGGTGTAKCGGNYAASLLPQAQATEHGCAQVAYLDAAEHRWVEEMGGMNLFYVFGSGESVEVVTPELSGSILPGITRDSLLVLAKELGCEVTERRISAEEWLTGCASGAITEVFACGTAAVITPVGKVKHNDGEVVVGGGSPGPVTMKLRDLLTRIQRGTAPDTHSWMRTLVR
ncbi:branched-chain amino acid aminotransferase [Pseudonocardia sp. KRD-184]|uniref:Branched-chain-amino-acid aminotransferase n=1 Tax=Pseudonocardia oceani TaxID=2792013 RepID=A0ABS6U3M5_9PSEU|nr:branched-chain amino acid aminotransferase [Pseudonocardia oceani]MBW0091228.1 branched-chain amino acid aminotransferase [Pseudonocardia oceani]MBW0097532.1 branched-chain amino acid aminotransferase [Pseudonocardia oceani]MBW0110727.1 branched-chain amino acid aminotransferase [Pseudonocardia oceani]MBW0124793.1 branched-chain amino acid aminotransferase [Pseudonocardia oceani]MBW0126840.1 branched-chain amino acid aminotransferase [Pseudonocardia oceani]